jgi:hypothetical protein
MNLYFDPHTRRIAYATQGSEFPTRMMVMEPGSMRMYMRSTLEHIQYTGALPHGFDPQTCWGYRLSITGTLEQAA